MAITYICVIIAIFLPLVWIACAKATMRYDNHAPRAQQAQLTGWRARANWAQQNAHEALPPFIAGVVIATQAGVPHEAINQLSLVFIICRILHGICYLKDWAWQRSLAWLVAVACVVGLLGMAIRQAA
ncbi:MAPEG family protein [Parachitinimonas caeni]|uniref:MAPEG family protein n=1 Tax=Parachitinimonas caeni TaxID=3031301 RepID=A0ABT7DYJ5_9NEIS|nr:MAPEG family protein [Parachitinimonas caeni]MDK2125137.1 MAPEG family protein [Parachitinimonas caeni]